MKNKDNFVSLSLANINKANIKEVKIMREGIHPAYYQAKVVCNCGNEFVTGSTKEEIHVEICSKCHPFYTGQQKATSARGRIDKFNKKYGVKND
jgi:large subunit ribosomal protein L31